MPPGSGVMSDRYVSIFLSCEPARAVDTAPTEPNGTSLYASAPSHFVITSDVIRCHAILQLHQPRGPPSDLYMYRVMYKGHHPGTPPSPPLSPPPLNRTRVTWMIAHPALCEADISGWDSDRRAYS